MLAISTAAADTESLMYRLLDHGRQGDPSFYLREFAAPAGCELDDEAAWAVANPALGDFLHADALRANLKTLRESSFRRYRLNQWVQDDDAWLPADMWSACAEPRPVPDGAEVVLALDGSFSPGRDRDRGLRDRRGAAPRRCRALGAAAGPARLARAGARRGSRSP